jgi:ubiquitin carboxyl-terminal hydrolase 34
MRTKLCKARTTKHEDVVLIGLFNLARILVSNDTSFRIAAGGLIQEIFFPCLFEIPTAENHGPFAPPKCKTPRSRKTAFKLLTELARDCPENFRELCGLLLKHHSG